MTRVMAQGVFDILHPGHLHYLRESAELGDELHVVIARDSRVAERKDLAMDEDSRREMVDALEMVDEAVLGSEESIFDTVEEVRPDVITLGYDQHHDEEELEEKLEEHGFGDVEVVRIGRYEGEIESSSEIREKLGPG
ncbi:MAG: adenylyltransferase/cytidyltransferase family protein, partial [Candidatus Nanohaloarchaea archaeon]|nr:adenylyltransferase/cytidyltransferase family protein [Candidatus Nanohaloarchaea archaeon]